jgi:hypothetical protein
MFFQSKNILESPGQFDGKFGGLKLIDLFRSFFYLDFLLKIIMPSKSFWLLLLLLSRLSV